MFALSSQTIDNCILWFLISELFKLAHENNCKINKFLNTNYKKSEVKYFS